MKRPIPAPSLESVPHGVRHDIEELAALTKRLCDQFGAEPWTGYAVAGEVAQGLAREWSEKHHTNGWSRGAPLPGEGAP